MTQLGHLLWWRVGEVNLTHADLEAILKDSSIEMPARPIPIDVFRKMTTTTRALYDLGEGLELECTIAPVESTSDKMLVHHLVGTVKRGNVTEAVRKIGEVIFYKPPRGQHSKARIRFVPLPYPALEKETAAFVAALRKQYEDGTKAGVLDGQAIRRLVRSHLERTGAAYVGGPYFFTAPEQIEDLEPLFAALGGDSFMFDVPIEDNERNRTFLDRRQS